MIIDTSAIIAILRDEPEAMACARSIADAVIRRISSVNFVESAVVIDASRDPIATRRFDDFIRKANISIEPVTEIQAQIANLLGLLLADQRPNRFDRHQHDALAERRTNKPVALVKSYGGLVYGVCNNSPRSSDFGCCKASSQSVRQERRPDTLASEFRIDSKAPDQ